MSRHRPPGVLRRTATTAAAGALALTGATALPATPADYYWWDVYQPCSHDLNGRFGSAARFASMTWESGTNRSYTTGSSSGCTTGDTWK